MKSPQPLRQGAGLLALSAVLWLAGCATCGLDPQVAQTTDSVRAQLGEPTEAWPHSDGSQRWTYWWGAYGRQTCMADFDAQGHMQKVENVLDEAHFLQVRPGMTQAQLRELLGPPSWIWHVQYHDQTVWSYRYVNPFCDVFHVGLTPAGIVEDSAHGLDPICDHEDRH
ncbi:outer membrane protein assembly factor BamE (plasmid) [Ideonella dechloratans]|nr:outer membrane protein assembly factor BamE [Ideonella dechloratans]UFU12516.1 outer membrane protein assembly factor BamE [Ideonella dechloratans]